jgi:DNA-binding NtrC family response regulator
MSDLAVAPVPLTAALPPTFTVDDDLRLAAAVDVPVLITASSRTERERCARVIHENGRGHGPFVEVVCGSGRPRRTDLTASTGTNDRDDLRPAFEHARGGTVFIDRIDRLAPPLQQELLGLLEERMAGAGAMPPPAAAGVRIVAGASRHFATARGSGAFSNLLFYRLNVIHLDLTAPPPIADRR